MSVPFAKPILTTFVFGLLLSAASLVVTTDRADAYGVVAGPVMETCTSTGTVMVTGSSLGPSSHVTETLHRMYWVYSFDGRRWSRTDTGWQRIDIQGSTLSLGGSQFVYAGRGSHFAVWEWRAQLVGGEWVFDGDWATYKLNGSFFCQP